MASYGRRSNGQRDDHLSGHPAEELGPSLTVTGQQGQRRGQPAASTAAGSGWSVPQPGITGGPFLSTLSGLSYNSGFDGHGYAARPERNAGRAFMA